MRSIVFQWGINFVVIFFLYTGFGFLLSRFLDSKTKNNPLTWLVFSVLFFPIFIGAQSLFFPINPLIVLTEGAISWIIALVLMYRPIGKKWRFSLLPEKYRAHWCELFIYLCACTIFLIILILPKLSLLNSNGAAVLDDYNNVNKLLATSFDLASPKFFHLPTVDLYYYYYDYLLSGTIFRLTSLHAQEALFIHNILEYIVFLSIFGYVTFFLFRKKTSRIFFVFCCTLFNGGLDYYLVSLFNRGNPGMTIDLEWWARDLFGLAHQISSLYTLFLWVPQHLIAGMAFLLMLLLTVKRESYANRILISILLAGILGFSSFVFVTAFISYALIELFYCITTTNQRSYLKAILFQMPIFALFALRPYLVYAGQQSPLFKQPMSIPLIKQSLFATNSFFDQVVLTLLPSANFLLSVLFILFIDLGIVSVFAIAYYLLGNSQKELADQQRAFGVYALITLVVSVAILFQMRSVGGNDLFMRGIIVSQITIMIAAALLLEKIHINKYAFSVFLIAMFFTQGIGVYTESTRLRNYTRIDFPALYVYIRENLPKDAAIFTDVVHSQGYFECPGVTFQANRMCFMNENEITFPRRQYAKNPASDTRNFHDLDIAKKIDLSDKYYLSSAERADPSLLLIWSDKQSYLYKIN